MTVGSQASLRPGLLGRGSPSEQGSRLASLEVRTPWGGRKLETLDRQEGKRKDVISKRKERRTPGAPKHNKRDECDYTQVIFQLKRALSQVSQNKA